MVVVEVSWKDWNDVVLRSPILTLVYFWHERCPWCRRFTPIFERLAAEYDGKVRFVKINVLESEGNRELAEDLGVMGTPTLIFFCEGRPLMHLIGFMPEEDLRKAINDMLGRYRTCLTQSTALKSYII